jgi:RNA polymerase sigma-70 factor (ECF subfamily)
MNRKTEAAAADTFEDVVLPNLDAAYRLARWLVGNEHDAEDVVQEASLRALRYFETFAGGNGRAWFLRIVRNTSYGALSRRPQLHTDVFDEEHHGGGQLPDPEALLLQSADAELVEEVLQELSGRFREVLVLREIEGLSYQELADVLGIPAGTVMSRLSRSRQAFRRILSARLQHHTRRSA